MEPLIFMQLQVIPYFIALSPNKPALTHLCCCLVVALKHGFGFIAKLGGMAKIEAYTHALFRYLLSCMKALMHYNQLPLCLFYSQVDLESTTSSAQGIVYAHRCCTVQYKLHCVSAFLSVKSLNRIRLVILWC
jgi:hypothetical protein